jgi:AcrR family transcriptional regulator
MTSTKRQETRNEIISVTEKLLSSVGRDTVTIRTIADLAKVQAPTIYRIFGDKVGLLNAVAEEGFTRYMTIKPEFDSSLGIIEELRKGWDIHVEFGIEHPELYK